MTAPYIPPPSRKTPPQERDIGAERRAMLRAALRLSPILAREKTLGVENTARSLGLADALIRSRQIMATPAADSAFGLSGGGQVGPFYPGNAGIRGFVADLLEGAQGGNPSVRRSDINELERRGFYNPLTGRSAFPASTTTQDERERILESAAAQHAHKRKMSFGGADDARRYANDFRDAYNFLIQSSKNPSAEFPNREGFFGGITVDMLKKPLFANHPLNKRR